MQGYAVYHEMDYAGRSFERGEYVELELGTQKNDQALLTIGYLKEHDGSDLLPCLRCGKKFVSNSGQLFLRKHEETCPMIEITVPSEAAPQGDNHDSDASLPDAVRPMLSQTDVELSQAEAVAQAPSQQGED